jgi:hypothetical protein
VERLAYNVGEVIAEFPCVHLMKNVFPTTLFWHHQGKLVGHETGCGKDAVNREVVNRDSKVSQKSAAWVGKEVGILDSEVDSPVVVEVLEEGGGNERLFKAILEARLQQVGNEFILHEPHGNAQGAHYN